MPPRRLIEHFAVVGLRGNIDDEKGSQTPQILYRYPRGPEDSLLGLKTCCYPDISKVVATDHLRKGNYLLTERYTFVLTRSNAARLFGFCFRFVAPEPDGSLRMYPTCLCLMSSYPFFGLFYDVLGYLSTRWVVQPDAVIPTVCAIGSVTINDALLLDTFEARIPSTQAKNSDEILKFHIQSTSYDMSFKTLFYSLGVDNVLFVLSCILLELRVITLSKSLQRLSECTHALHGLLYPFVWQHIFIPLLPESLASYLSSPIPFLIGVPYYIFKNFKKKDLSSVILVNLDSDQVSTTSGLSELTKLPEKLSSRLRDQLNRTLKERLGDERWKAVPKAKAAFHESSKKLTGAKESQILPWDDQEIANAFLAFFVVLANDYKHYIPELDSDHERAEQYEEDIKDFLEKLSHSQLFNQWLEKQQAIEGDPSRKNRDRFSHALTYISGSSYTETFKFLQTNYQTKRAATDVVLKLKGLKAAVMEYTSNKAKESKLPLIAQAICSNADESRTINTVFDVLEFRLSDSAGKMYMHGIRALNLLQYLLERGIDLVVAVTHYRLIGVIRRFLTYMHKNEKTKIKLRELGRRIFELLQKVPELKKYRSNRYVRLDNIEQYRCYIEVTADAKDLLYARLLKVDFSRESAAESAFVDVLGLGGKVQAPSLPPSKIEHVQVFSKFNPLKSAKYRQKALEGNVPDIPPFQHLHGVFMPGAKLKRKQRAADFGGSTKSKAPSLTKMVANDLEAKKNNSEKKIADMLDLFPFFDESPTRATGDNADMFKPTYENRDFDVFPDERLGSRNDALVPPATLNTALHISHSPPSNLKSSETDDWDDFDEAFKKNTTGSNATNFFHAPVASQNPIPNRAAVFPAQISSDNFYSKHRKEGKEPSSDFFSALNVPQKPAPYSQNLRPKAVSRSRGLSAPLINPYQHDFFTQLQPSKPRVNDGSGRPIALPQINTLPIKLRRPNDPFAGLN